MSLRPGDSENYNTSPTQKSRRGNTCLNCRRRKIKCDGTRPICNHCLRGGTTFEDCEYPTYEGPSQVQLLEDRISAVKSRIRAVEAPDQGHSITLYHPYSSDDSFVSTGSSPMSSMGSLRSKTPGPMSMSSSSSPFHHRMGSNSLRNSQEPSPSERRNILDIFFSNAYQFSFFLDVKHFRESMVLVQPIGDKDRPSPALVTSIYLWGSHLSASKGLEEHVLLQNALHYLSGDLSGSHPHKVIHSIQAEVLLSYYYLKNFKMHEGKHHADVALSLALAAGLNRIRSSHSSSSSISSQLPYPANGMEENERIDAFWAVVVLNNYFSAIQKSPLAFSDPEPDVVDTPWPLDSYQHEYHLLPRNSFSSLQRFLDGSSTSGLSEKALFVKATVLLARATSIHNGDLGSILRSGEFGRLSSVIDELKKNLPPVDRPGSSSSSSSSGKERRVVIHVVAHAATIKLHLPLARENQESRRKCVHAAQTIAYLTMNAQTIVADPSRLYVDLILGVVWTSAGEVLMICIKSGTYSAEDRSAFTASMQAISNQLARYSERSKLFKFLMTRIQKPF